MCLAEPLGLLPAVPAVCGLRGLAPQLCGNKALSLLKRSPCLQLPPALQKQVLILVSVTQAELLEVSSLPEDQDVVQEAKLIATHLEKLRKKNPLVVKEVSKVKSDLASKAHDTTLLPVGKGLRRWTLSGLPLR